MLSVSRVFRNRLLDTIAEAIFAIVSKALHAGRLNSGRFQLGSDYCLGPFLTFDNIGDPGPPPPGNCQPITVTELMTSQLSVTT